jgi:hypothetical protein
LGSLYLTEKGLPLPLVDRPFFVKNTCFSIQVCYILFQVKITIIIMMVRKLYGL